MPDTFRTILITGATGSLGQALTRFLLETTSATLRLYSRSELPQALMRQRFGENDRLRYLLGDVRDLARLHTAMVGVDLVIHAAALKRIDQGEYDAEEFLQVNVNGTLNVIRACRTMNVKRAVLIGTDKAVYAINTYGLCKGLAERLWTRANGYAPQGTHYSTVRYGNVSSSRGSVIPIWQEALREGKALPVTHAAMSRFYIDLAEAVRLVWFAAHHAPRGSILVPHLPAYDVETLARAVVAQAGMVWEQVRCQDIGIRPGEKLAETLASDEERATMTAYVEQERPLYYCIPPVAPSWKVTTVPTWGLPGRWEAVAPMEPYRSDTWSDRLSVDDVRHRLAQEMDSGSVRGQGGSRVRPSQ